MITSDQENPIDEVAVSDELLDDPNKEARETIKTLNDSVS
jgi:hypothetical protein